MTKKTITAITLSLGILLCIYIGTLIYQASVFHLVSTDPNTNNFAAISSFVKINFNRTLSNDIKVTTNPSSYTQSFSISGTSITIKLNPPLVIGQHFLINLSNISDNKGNKLKDISLDFIAKNIPENKLSSEQKKALSQIQQNYDSQILSDPLVKLLPFTSGGNDFEVSYNINQVNNKPSLVIDVAALTTQGQKDALNWIKQLGIDPNNYTIKYSIGSVGSPN